MTNNASAEEELLTLQAQHQRLESRIEAFDQHRWLSEKEQTERKRLQKLKLATKDRMMRLKARRG